MSFSLTELRELVRQHLLSPHGGGGSEHIVDEAVPVDPVDGLLWTHPTEDATVPVMVPIGSMMMWPVASAPAGWLICDGSTFSAGSYPDLATLLGGTTLPDMRGRFPIGVGTLGSDTYAVGATGGEARHVLSGGEVGAHSHTLANHNHALPNHVHSANHNHDLGTQAEGTQMLGRGASGSGANELQTTGGRSITAVTQTKTTTMNTGNPTTNPNTGDPDNNSTSTSPAASAHENRPPYRAVNFIIKAGP